MNEKELLLTEIFHCTRSEFYLKDSLVLRRAERLRLEEILRRRIAGEPLQYILGKINFMGFDLKVNSHVFIPRPETELLVEVLLGHLKSLDYQSSKPLEILDIGTGSGCIAIVLAKLLQNARIIAIDISGQAIKTALANARAQAVDHLIRFRERDIRKMQYSRCQKGRFSVLVSNPPYIPQKEIVNLPREVGFEPKLALDGGKNGLRFYRLITEKASWLLKSGGILALEMGVGQGETIKNIFQKWKNFEIIETIHDYQGYERIIVAKKSEQVKKTYGG